jgi:cell wall-associated NlpC family hydrolase
VHPVTLSALTMQRALPKLAGHVRHPTAAPSVHAARMSARVATLVLGTLLAVAGGARAAPDSEPPGAAPADPVLQLLREQGLVAPPGSPAAEAPILREMRAQAAGVRDRAADAVLTALAFVGVRYRRGGNDEASGFDCSGFTRYVFGRTLGVALPRRVDEQARAPGLVAVPRAQLQPGDLVFFNTLKRTFSHVGIYVGDNRFVHAPRPGGEVRTEDMGGTYWRARFTGARRLEAMAAPAAPLPDPAGAPLLR